MREIRFRFYGTFDFEDKPRMMYGDSWAFEDYLPIDAIFKQVQSNDVVVMQYTGLRDKNGVEIYEGDVVRSSDEGETRFKDDAGVSHQLGDCGEASVEFAYGMWYLHGDINNSLFDIVETSGNDVEVIGNIWENKELLDDSK